MRKKLKILISSYACSPYYGSEPGLGWQIINSLAVKHEVHAIVEEEKFKKDIENYFKETSPNPNLKIYFIRKKRARFLRKVWPPSYYWFYKRWQYEVYKLATNLEQEHSFDIFHQFNMIGFREPGYLWKNTDKPLIWGPVGGFAQVKWKYLPMFSFYDFVYYGMRNIINYTDLVFKSRVRKMAERADIIISASIDSQSGFTQYFRKNTILINETGCTLKKKTSKLSKRSDLNLVWVGNMDGGKALIIALKSLAMLPKEHNIRITVIGSGNKLNYIKKAKKLGIDSLCFFLGKRPYDETQKIIAESDLLIFTSLKEGTPHVILESLSHGVPVICHNANGQATVINKSCGIKIEMLSPRKSIEGFCSAINSVYKDRDLLNKLSIGAYKRAEELSWNKKAYEIETLYFKAIQKVNEKKNR